MSLLRRPLLTLLLFIVFAVFVQASEQSTLEGYALNLTEGASINGTKSVYASGKDGDRLILKVDGKEYLPVDKSPEIRILYEGGDGTADRAIKTESTYNASNMIGLNGRNLGRFPSDGSKGFGINTSRLVDGENAIFVIIGGYWGNGTYNEKKPHGQAAGNQGSTKDDFLLSNVHFVLPDGQVVLPDGFISYKALAVGSTEKVVTRYEPYPFKNDEMFWLGDGWGSYDTWAGNSTDKTVINSVDKGRYDIPYKVEFLLNYKKPGSEAVFELDTNALEDGTHTVEFYAGEVLVSKINVIVDNSAPEITTNLENYQTISNGYQVTGNFSDAISGLKNKRVLLEGQKIADSQAFTHTIDNIDPGVYSLIFEASDNAGNTVYQSLYFHIDDEKKPEYKITAQSDGSYSLTVPGGKKPKVTLYDAKVLDFTASYGTSTGGKELSVLHSFGNWHKDQIKSGNGNEVTVSTTGIPYHLFDIDVSNTKSAKIYISYAGKTLSEERLAVKLYNPNTSKWDTIATGYGEATLSAEVAVRDYVSNGIIRVMATPDYVTNGSDTLLWITDPQHYTKFPDLNDFYYAIYEYSAEEYLKGNVGYLISTGDLVDDSPDSALAPNQWKIADRAFSYVDSVLMPNGAVSGNHDTANYPSVDYSLYKQYFGAARYRDKAWFGGSLNDNESHYDLVTIGNTDLVVLYLGYGVEGTPETIAWANQILQKYKHRNAIISTHQYLKATTGGWDETSRAKVIYNEIVVPNDNVKMLLCGHSDGAVTLKRQIGERTFYEILSDYQFVQREPDSYYNGNKHYIGDVPYCNGEGYMRSMTFNGNTVATKTFSPVTGGTNPHGSRDEFTITVDFIPAQREITTYSFSAVELNDKLQSSTLKENQTYDILPTSNKTLVALINDKGNSVVTAPLNRLSSTDGKPDTPLIPVDLANLKALVDATLEIDTTNYLADSAQELERILLEVATVLEKGLPLNREITAAYTKLTSTLANLQPKGEGVIDPNDLEVLFEYSLALADWQNSAGPKALDAEGSYLQATPTRTNGITIEKTDSSPNGWPQMRSKSVNVTVTPVDGRIYLQLDIEAGSAWVIYPQVRQERKSVAFRMNYIIEGLTQAEADGGPGVFKGVYDVTKAFLDHGFDLTKPLQISMMFNAVPGPVTINTLTLMTNKPISK